MMKRVFTNSILISLVLVLIADPAHGARLCGKIFKKSREEIIQLDAGNKKRMQYVMMAKEKGEPTVIIYLNSLTYNLQGIKKIKGLDSYTSRLMGPAIAEVMKNPSVTVVYPTNKTISNAEVLHFARPFIRERMRKNPLLTEQGIIADLMTRFHIIEVAPTRESIFLVDHALASPILATKIQFLVAGRNAYIQPYIGTALEARLAAQLNIPLNASSRVNTQFGNTKSGNALIFRAANVPSPMSKINLESRREVATGIYEMWKESGHKKYMVKLEESASGKGNASFKLEAHHIRQLQDKSKEEAIAYIEKLLYHHVKPQGSLSSREYWDVEFKAQREIMVEQFIPRYREGVDPSPSAQFHIGPGGRISIVSTHEQIFHPTNRQTFVGSSYPAKQTYRKEIVEYTLRIAEQLAQKGMIGHGGVDFIVTRDGKVYAIEINARMNGTSHSLLVSKSLQKDPREDFFTISTDNFESPKLKNFRSIEELLEHPEIKPLLYNIQRGNGVTFHIMGAMRSNQKIGYQAIAQTPQKARQLYNRVKEILSP